MPKPLSPVRFPSSGPPVSASSPAIDQPQVALALRNAQQKNGKVSKRFHENSRAQVERNVGDPSKPVLTSSIEKTLPGLPAELVLQIMALAGPDASTLRAASRRFRTILHDDVLQLFPALLSLTTSLQNRVKSLRQMDESELPDMSAAVDSMSEFGDKELTSRDLLDLSCDLLEQLVKFGSQMFKLDEAENLTYLQTTVGLKHAGLYHDFLKRFDQDGCTQSMLPELAMIGQHFFTLPDFDIDTPDTEDFDGETRIPEAAQRRKTDFTYALLTSSYCQPGTIHDNKSIEALAFAMQAYAQRDPQLTAYVEQHGDMWKHPKFPHQQVLKARVEGDTELSTWLMKPDSPWLALEEHLTERLVDMASIGSAQLRQWIFQNGSALHAMDTRQLLDVDTVFWHKNPAYIGLVMEKTAVWTKATKEIRRVLGPQPFHHGHSLSTVHYLRGNGLALDHAWAGFEIEKHFFNFLPRVMQALHQAEKPEKFNDDLLERLLVFTLKNGSGMWEIAVPKVVAHVRPTQAQQSDAKFFHQRTEKLIECIEIGNVRVLEWLTNEAPASLNKRLDALVLAARSGNDRFIEFVLDKDNPIEDMPLAQIEAIAKRYRASVS